MLLGIKRCAWVGALKLSNINHKVIMKKYLIAIGSFLLPLVALANGAHEEDPSIIHQLEEFLPFEHLEHDHWFAVVLSVLLWASLVYTAYSLVQKFRKPQ